MKKIKKMPKRMGKNMMKKGKKGGLKGYEALGMKMSKYGM